MPRGGVSRGIGIAILPSWGWHEWARLILHDARSAQHCNHNRSRVIWSSLVEPRQPSTKKCRAGKISTTRANGLILLKNKFIKLK